MEQNPWGIKTDWPRVYANCRAEQRKWIWLAASPSWPQFSVLATKTIELTSFQFNFLFLRERRFIHPFPVSCGEVDIRGNWGQIGFQSEMCCLVPGLRLEAGFSECREVNHYFETRGLPPLLMLHTHSHTVAHILFFISLMLSYNCHKIKAHYIWKPVILLKHDRWDFFFK